MSEPSEVVGLVLGTEDGTPLEFWVAIAPGHNLQLDDVVALDRALATGEKITHYGIVGQVRARHEGARFDSDVFLIADGILPAEVSESAMVQLTRVVPETFVPPLPGSEVRKATAEERDEALDFTDVERRLPAGLSRDNEPIYLDLDFVDGTKGAHINISGISGVATKTSYATFLLYSLFRSGVLAEKATNTKGLIFNVKGEDLLFLDYPNTRLDEEARSRYSHLGLEAAPFTSVGIVAPPRPGDPNATPQTGPVSPVRGLPQWLDPIGRHGAYPSVTGSAQVMIEGGPVSPRRCGKEPRVTGTVCSSLSAPFVRMRTCSG